MGKVTAGIRYGHHIGPCSEAGIGEGEVAVCYFPGSPYSLAAHAVGSPEEAIALALDRGAEPRSVAGFRRALAGEEFLSRVPHVCECHRREFERRRGEIQRQCELYINGSGPLPDCPIDAGYVWYLRVERARAAATEQSSRSGSDDSAPGGMKP